VHVVGADAVFPGKYVDERQPRGESSQPPAIGGSGLTRAGLGSPILAVLTILQELRQRS
jgi:hypothetical protein